MVKSPVAEGGGAGGVVKGNGQEKSTPSVTSQDDENEMMMGYDDEMEIDETAMNYDFAMKEVILNELNSGVLSSI